MRLWTKDAAVIARAQKWASYFKDTASIAAAATGTRRHSGLSLERAFVGMIRGNRSPRDRTQVRLMV